MWQRMRIVVGLLVTTLLQIYRESFSEKKSMDRLRFEGDYGFMATRLWPHFFGPRCISTWHRRHLCSATRCEYCE